MRFSHPLQGRGPRSPKTGKVVLGCLIGVGVSISANAETLRLKSTSISYSHVYYHAVAAQPGYVELEFHVPVVPIPQTERPLHVTMVEAGDPQLSIDSTLRLARLLRRIRERRLQRNATL
jgi:hypothetical protein